jgi:hypothetical protein
VITLVAPRHGQEAKLDGGAPFLPLLQEEIRGLFDYGYRLLVPSLAERYIAGVA